MFADSVVLPQQTPGADNNIWPPKSSDGGLVARRSSYLRCLPNSITSNSESSLPIPDAYNSKTLPLYASAAKGLNLSSSSSLRLGHLESPMPGEDPGRSLLRGIKTVNTVTNTKYAAKHDTDLTCHLCFKHFTRKYSLRSHLRAHCKKLPFACSVCGRAFARQHDSKRHEKWHSSSKQFIHGDSLHFQGQWGCPRASDDAERREQHEDLESPTENASQFFINTNNLDLPATALDSYMDGMNDGEQSTSSFPTTIDHDIYMDDISDATPAYSIWPATHVQAVVSSSITAVDIRSQTLEFHSHAADMSVNDPLWCEAEVKNNLGISATDVEATVLEYYPTSSQTTSPTDVPSASIDTGQLCNTLLPRCIDNDIDVVSMSYVGPAYSAWWASYIHGMTTAEMATSRRGQPH